MTESADIGKAVDGVLKAAFGYSGQKCSACSRVYVHRKVRDEFVSKLAEKAKSLPVGNPLDQNTFVGPLVNESAYKNYQKYARIAARDGKVLAGGAVRKGGDMKHGYYVEPTVVTGLPKNHRLFREEMFVPILCVAEYDEFDDALKMANSSDYGLTAGIFTAKREEIIELLKKAYWMEIETVMSYIANSVNPDGVRAQEVKDSLSQDIQEELGHAQQFAARIKELYGVVPGSQQFTAVQSFLQPPDEQIDVVHVIKGVIEAEQGAIEHYSRIVEETDGVDPVTQDMMIAILHDEQGHKRMFEGFLREYEAAGLA